MKTKEYLEMLKDHYLEQILDTEKFKAFYLREKPDSRMMSTLFVFTPEGIVLMGDLTPELHATASCLGYGLNWFAGHLSETYLCEKFLQKGWHSEIAAEELLGIAEDIMHGEHDNTYANTKDLHKASKERYDLHEELESCYTSLKDEKAGGIEEDISAARQALEETKLRQNAARMELRVRRLELSNKFRDLARETEYGHFGPESFGSAYADLDECMDDIPGWGYEPRHRYLLCALQQKFSELYHKKAGTVPD